jgi:CBS domain-containing protein
MTIDAASIMTRNVVTVGPDDSVAHIAALLAEHEISAAPVCDKDGKLLGVLSEGDLMRPFGQENALRRAWWLGVLAEGTDLAPEFLDYLRVDRRRARDLMQPDVVTATERTSTGEIADLLTKHRIKRVPIVRDGKLVGIVSRADLIRAMAHSPEALTDPM